MKPAKSDIKDGSLSNNNELVTANNIQHSFLYRFGTKAAIYTGGAAGSWAAAWQCIHVFPSIFSLLQSVAATGMAKGTVITFAAGGAVTKAFIRKIPHDKKNPEATKTNDKVRIQSKL
ncbi:unnamed protein product [Rotaria socialis]|uniref:Uncharacterized protein n=1 Tax=Rotaria socialis TaxID=392032 RepID=A0A821IEJ4_9BILA|nr:unnamed protein product [Rotaria socialis]